MELIGIVTLAAATYNEIKLPHAGFA